MNSAKIDNSLEREERLIKNNQTIYILLYFPFFAFHGQRAVYTQYIFNKFIFVVTIVSRQNVERARRITKG